MTLTSETRAPEGRERAAISRRETEALRLREFPSLSSDALLPSAGSLPNGFLLTGHETHTLGKVRDTHPRDYLFHGSGLDLSFWLRFRDRHDDFLSGVDASALCRPLFHEKLGRNGAPAHLSASSVPPSGGKA